MGLIGSVFLFMSLKGVPWLNTKLGLHPMTDDERQVIRQNPVLRIWFKNAKKWFDHPLLFLGNAALWGVGFILLTGTFYILLTDIGWLSAWQSYVAIDPNYSDFFLMARASGQPNGAHLPSYIAVVFLGVYVSWKYRKGVFADVYQGILVVGFTVAAHEGLWLIAYFTRYYGELGLALTSNFVEDFFFGIMCVMLVTAFWKYPLRTIKLETFHLPILIYWIYLSVWFYFGLPVTTINNWTIGQGIYGITEWFANPLVNGIEIGGWILISSAFLLAIRHEQT